MIAWTWSDDFHLREEIAEILDILDVKGFGDTQEKIILQCLAGMLEKTTRTKDILSLSPDSVRANISNLRSGLEKTIDFLSTELHAVSSDFLPHSHQIVPLTFFFYRVNTPSHYQTKILKQWFWKTSFSNRYSGSTDMKMNDDILFFEKVINDDFSDIKKYSYSIDKDSLLDQTFSKSNPYTRSFLLLLAQNKPLNLINGNEIDLGEALSKYNSKEYHHIFPRNYLKGVGKDTYQINSLCNFCFLPADSNKTVSNKPPSDYIVNTVLSAENANRILSSNLLPLEQEIYEKNQYENFLEKRAGLIMQYLDSQIAN